jgi:hypothetical protein
MDSFERLPPELLPAILGAPAAHLRLVCWRWLRALQCAFPKRDHKTLGEAGAVSAGLAAWYCELDPRCYAWLCSFAAEGGHLATLQWARAQNPPCPWDAMTCAGAAAGGHLELLQWARAQSPPCPWDTTACRLAAEGNRLALLQWARAQDPPCLKSIKSGCVA